MGATALNSEVRPGVGLRSRRLRLGLSQVSLAEAVGCGVGTISMWERGFMPLRPTPALRLIERTLDRLEQQAAEQA